MHEHYTSSTWERGDSVITGGDISGCYREFTGDVGLLVTPDSDASEMGDLLRDSCWSFGDWLEFGQEWFWKLWLLSKGLIWRRQLIIEKLQKGDMVAWTCVSILLRVNCWPLHIPPLFLTEPIGEKSEEQNRLRSLNALNYSGCFGFFWLMKKGVSGPFMWISWLDDS